MKKSSKGTPRMFHEPKSKKGSGDYLGTGVKNPMAVPREIMGVNVSSKKAKTLKPPRSLA